MPHPLANFASLVGARMGCGASLPARLNAAAEQGDVDAVQSMLASGADVNAQNEVRLLSNQLNKHANHSRMVGDVRVCPKGGGGALLVSLRLCSTPCPLLGAFGNLHR